MTDTARTAAPAIPPATPAGARRRGVLLVSAALVGGLLLGLAVGPHEPRADEPSGDPELAADLERAFGDPRGFGAVTAARVRDGAVAVAGLGDTGVVPGPDTRYEPGSIVKTFTGMLLADGIERGELRLTDRLGTWLPELGGSPAGSVTLQELATHSSGLPSVPPATAAASVGPVLAHENPYGVPTAQLIDDARATPLGEHGTYAYSNLGMSLLGHAEARAAGAPDWPTLLRTRLLDPLGMTATRITVDGPDPAVVPMLSNGWRAPSWWGEGFAPSGTSATTTVTDLARFAEAVLAGRAPGTAALEPIAPAGGSGEIGLAWHVTEVGDRTVTWHNGGTGGHRALLVLDRERGEAVVVLNNTDRWVDEQGMALLLDTSSTTGPATAPAIWVTAAIGLLMLVGSAVSLLRTGSRTRLVGAVLLGGSALVLLLTQGPWAVVPGAVWAALAAGWVACAVLGLRRWPVLPAGSGGWRRIGDGAVVLLGGALLAAVAWMA
ncbi:serine hydrolase domain-containing protein [Pseudonocardia parietis]|uniref:CubicO group peptidase (Beta-lactamase class C family) n=1 Tax=Pseudonocardia parietis TaxID=570936 RepID=A0ABS4W3L3_9PSEU|nr:serine hydrolase domain-containing protein [Pseudonocardia parietis]MBP2370761.1 CubicO group peptidase (beta-lactamase class C family) [Pseudonocardia parietis]